MTKDYYEAVMRGNAITEDRLRDRIKELERENEILQKENNELNILLSVSNKIMKTAVNENIKNIK